MRQPESPATPRTRTAASASRARVAATTSSSARVARPAAPATTAAGSEAGSSTRDALLAAARAEFDRAGFDGTDSNRIARRAGFAPQTFYRHFRDKTEVFVEVYRRWFEEEWKDLKKAQGKGADEAARILLDHHARHRELRRSLRALTIRDDVVRAARAESRRQQLGLVAAEDQAGGRTRDGATRVALLFCVERLADAAADGELDDLGLKKKEQLALVADVIRRLARER